MKYIIEDGINFYEELYKGLDKNDDNKPDMNRCLITNNELTETHIKLDCSHCFNYQPLMNDLTKQKQTYGIYSQCAFFMKCPYCRNNINHYLPVRDGTIEIPGIHVPLIRPNTNTQNCINIFTPTTIQCNHILPNSSITCSHKSIVKLDNEKQYCIYHKTSGIYSFLNDNKIQQKKDKQLAKDKQNELKLKKDEELKLKTMIAKQKKESKLSKNKKDNVIIDYQITIQPVGCCQLLKTGVNKGSSCGCKVFEKNSMCLRHYNLNNK